MLCEKIVFVVLQLPLDYWKTCQIFPPSHRTISSATCGPRWASKAARIIMPCQTISGCLSLSKTWKRTPSSIPWILLLFCSPRLLSITSTAWIQSASWRRNCLTSVGWFGSSNEPLIDWLLYWISLLRIINSPSIGRLIGPFLYAKNSVFSLIDWIMSCEFRLSDWSLDSLHQV